MESPPPNIRTELASQDSSGRPQIPQELTHIVQQQLDGLATQNYAWQGQIWQGQNMEWEISPDGSQPGEADAATRWQTRLKLSLPTLGSIDAVLRFSPGGSVDISLNTGSDASKALMNDSINALKSQMESAGLNLTQVLVQHVQPAE